MRNDGGAIVKHGGKLKAGPGLRWKRGLWVCTVMNYVIVSAQAPGARLIKPDTKGPLRTGRVKNLQTDSVRPFRLMTHFVFVQFAHHIFAKTIAKYPPQQSVLLPSRSPLKRLLVEGQLWRQRPYIPVISACNLNIHKNSTNCNQTGGLFESNRCAPSKNFFLFCPTVTQWKLTTHNHWLFT